MEDNAKAEDIIEEWNKNPSGGDTGTFYTDAVLAKEIVSLKRAIKELNETVLDMKLKEVLRYESK